MSSNADSQPSPSPPLPSSVWPDAFTVFPAIDLRGGRCVRLYQGDYGRETIYGDDPVVQAEAFAAAGARVLHVVDLDAARTGEPTNRSVIADICAASSMPVQVGGGVRNEGAAEALFTVGVSRVVIGTAALERPELVGSLAEAGHSIAVGIDARGNEVATHGWTERTGRTTTEVAAQFTDLGVDALIVTEIGRDGTMEGPDIEGLRALLAETETTVIASGGVGTLAHIAALTSVALTQAGKDERGLGGVIVGRALYEGVFSLAQALEVAGGRP
ncbi:MAG: 1-(5-phosphoribosyl)-5-[(5-phosphoribosylamino)methylideneamino]imidazole-4-carboxamide isomerase [Actinomycetia bacterium]|nr:1-(5-phosphoribosyl)-5-[(5-phosphoribosylamino)methylideneamino]imidazole-4-carboxamide isomerase [Actinomycetes bacterium]